MGWGREGFSCICSVDDVTLMMFRGGVGWGGDIDVHAHVPLSG